MSQRFANTSCHCCLKSKISNYLLKYWKSTNNWAVNMKFIHLIQLYLFSIRAINFSSIPHCSNSMFWLSWQWIVSLRDCQSQLVFLPCLDIWRKHRPNSMAGLGRLHNDLRILIGYEFRSHLSMRKIWFVNMWFIGAIYLAQSLF